MDDACRVVFGRPGAPHIDVATSIGASSAVPGYFAPVTIHGRRYVDGGVHSPTNADVLRREELDHVIVSSPMSISNNANLRRPSRALRGHFRARLAIELRKLRRAGIEVRVFQPSEDDLRVMGNQAMDDNRMAAVARQAQAGDPACKDMYLIYPDRAGPDEYERTLPEVFPDNAPGSFTEVPGLGWVWTTFHRYQWDLNWASPSVLRAMLGVMLTLANRGVDVLRLDAAPFLWKRMGTDCQNQPEAHLIVQALRALTRLAAPGLLLKAEAIVGPDQLVQYVGGHDRYRPECDLAYDNQLMVMLWSTLATRDARLAGHALSRRRPVPPATAWVTYVRCHDDIGWAVTDTDAAAVGLDGYAHRRFLSEFYAGRFPGSFARGALFQDNPATGDARISGTAAALCGIEAALGAGDRAGLAAAVRRLVSLYAVAFSFGGIPLIYMGDELGIRNDHSWSRDPAQAGDNRWMHRPRMDWAAAARRHDPSALEGQVFGALAALSRARRGLLALRSGGQTEVIPTGHRSVLVFRRAHPRSAPFLSLTNFSDTAVTVDAEVIARAGLNQARLVHGTEPGTALWADRVQLPAWGFAWLAGR